MALKTPVNQQEDVVPAVADVEALAVEPHQHEHEEEDDEHVHYSQRSPWLRAFILGANDGLVSVASIMLGVGGGTDDITAMRLAGIAGWIAGATSMALGEYISVAGQRDAEEADVEKERQQQAKGPAAQAHELDELTQIYVNRGLSRQLARQVAEELTAKDVIRAHARDELGIDLDDMSNPWQAAGVSALAFTLGAAMPLLAGAFIASNKDRILSVALVSAFGLGMFGFIGAALGGARVIIGALRVLVGGCLAMAITFAIGLGFGQAVQASLSVASNPCLSSQQDLSTCPSCKTSVFPGKLTG